MEQNKQPITHEQFKALDDEQKKLYGPLVATASRGGDSVVIDLADCNYYGNRGYLVTKLHYPLPVENKQPKEEYKIRNFKEVFQSTYGDGSFNDEFVINALSAENIHSRCMPTGDELNGIAIKLYLQAKTGSLEDFIKKVKAIVI